MYKEGLTDVIEIPATCDKENKDGKAASPQPRSGRSGTKKRNTTEVRGSCITRRDLIKAAADYFSIQQTTLQ